MKLSDTGFVRNRFQDTISAVQHHALLKTRFCVAKVVKTFGCIAQTTETLDEFHYRAGLFISDALWSEYQ